jgi:hypothetical protein
VIILKSGIGAKIAMVALGLTLGVGGIAVGAGVHARLHPGQANHGLFYGTVTAATPATFTMHTARGITLTIHLPPRLKVHHRLGFGGVALATGDTVLVEVLRARTGTIYAVYVLVVHRPTTAMAQAP